MKSVIMAVRKRAPMVDYLQSHLPDVTVCWDDISTGKKEGVWPTFLKTMQIHGDEGHLHFEDDATLCVDFYEKALEVIGDGTHVVQFMYRWHEFKHEGNYPKGLIAKPGSTFAYTCAFYLPPGYGTKIANYAPYWDQYARLHPNSIIGSRGGMSATRFCFDYLIADWLTHTKQKYIAPGPSLVQHTPMPSAMGHGNSRMSFNVVDEMELENHPYPHLVHLDPWDTELQPLDSP